MAGRESRAEIKIRPRLEPLPLPLVSYKTSLLIEFKNLTPDHSIGITLSGGGARGAAHIGVLRALGEAGIVPDKVVGVSAGAIAGVLYAAGLSPDEMLDFVKEISMVKVIKFGIPRTGLTTMDYLRERLGTVLENDDFMELKRPLCVGATNLNTGKFQLFDQGPLIEAVAASCSIPFVFKPVELNGELFVDGGIMCNMPVEPLEDQVDYIIGSNLIPESHVPVSDLTSVIGISWRCFDLSVMANTLNCRPCCDLLFEPPAVANHNIFSFKKIQELHDIGYNYAKTKITELRSVTDLV
ncbi:patatin [Lewinellaceae bacterium SD302]|nr:patatin [Lewinellaceae bacterium SD302]